MSLNKIVAIDLGSSRISALLAEIQPNDEIRVITEESKEADDVKGGIVEQASGAAFKVNELIRYLQNDSQDHDIHVVSVPVGAKTMKHKRISVSQFVGKSGLVTQDLIDKMLDECRYKATEADKDIFDIIPLAYIIDGKTMDEPVGQKAKQIIGEYNVISGSKQVKVQLDRCFDRTGIGIEFSPLAVEALSTVLLENDEREMGCALINFGASATTIAVYHKGALQEMLVVPLGAAHITRDIQELGISEVHAERLKLVKGTAMSQLVDDPIYIQIPSVIPGSEVVKISTEFLATIIEARLEEITQPLFDLIAKLDFELEAGIVITGGGSKLNGMVDFVTERTSLYTRYGDHSEWLSEDTNQKFYDPCYSQLIGTVVLTNEFRKAHPVEKLIEEPEKTTKLPRKSKIRKKLSDKLFTFFSDDNKL